MSHIDPSVTVTDAQRAAIEYHDLTVTEEFGHVVVADFTVLKPFARKTVGNVNDPKQGRVHAPAEQLPELLDQIMAAKPVPTMVPAETPRAPKAAAVPKAQKAAKPADSTATSEDKGRRRGKAAANTEVAVTASPAHKEAGVPHGGVIGNLVGLLSDGAKRTRGELYDALVALFPDRATEKGGMRVTVSVQLAALVKKGHKIVICSSDRGKLYYILAE